MTNLNNKICELSINELDTVSGGASVGGLFHFKVCISLLYRP